MEASPPERHAVVNVLFFSALRQLTGHGELERSLPLPATAGDLWEELQMEYPGLGEWKQRVLIAVNLNYADWHTSLASEDEVAFMPPVQGG